MATIDFTNGTIIPASWLNDVNTKTYADTSNTVGYTPAGTGAVATTVQAKLRESVSILDFGADPTGAVSIVAAVNLAQAAHTKITIPAGIYLIATNLTISSYTTIDLDTQFTFSGGATLTFGPGAISAISPEWFYTTGGYQTALSKAFLIQRASVVVGIGVSSYGSVIPVSLQPNKQYVLTGTIVGQDYLTLYGNKAAILSSASYPYDHSYPIITGIGYQPTILQTTFIGGLNILVFPENAQGFDIVIDECKFTDWYGVAIFSSATPHAQHLILTRCEFTARSILATICDIAFDNAVMRDCQYTGPSQTKFINRDNLSLENWITSPTAPTNGEVYTAPPCWIYNVGVTLSVINFRFGGESGAHRILQQEIGTVFQGQPTSILITNSEIFTGSDYLMMLDAIPANFVFRDNYGNLATYCILYGPSAPLSDNLNIGRTNVVLDAGINASSRLAYGSLSSVNNGGILPRLAVASNRYKILGTSTIVSAAKVADLLYTGMSGAVQPLFTVTTTTDIFGATVQKITGSDGNASFNSYAYFNATSLTGLAAGIYTVVVNITVLGNPVSFGIIGSLHEKFWNLTSGNHTLSMELFFDGTNNPTVGYSAYNVDAATFFAHNGLRLFSGSADVQTWNTLTYANAPPSAGYNRLGDKVIILTPVVGQPKGWFCTVAGTPGTWVSEGNL